MIFNRDLIERKTGRKKGENCFERQRSICSEMSIVELPSDILRSILRFTECSVEEFVPLTLLSRAFRHSITHDSFWRWLFARDFPEHVYLFEIQNHVSPQDLYKDLYVNGAYMLIPLKSIVFNNIRVDMGHICKNYCFSDDTELTTSSDAVGSTANTVHIITARKRFASGTYTFWSDGDWVPITYKMSFLEIDKESYSSLVACQSEILNGSRDASAQEKHRRDWFVTRLGYSSTYLLFASPSGIISANKSIEISGRKLKILRHLPVHGELTVESIPVDVMRHVLKLGNFSVRELLALTTLGRFNIFGRAVGDKTFWNWLLARDFPEHSSHVSDLPFDENGRPVKIKDVYRDLHVNGAYISANVSHEMLDEPLYSTGTHYCKRYNIRDGVEFVLGEAIPYRYLTLVTIRQRTKFTDYIGFWIKRSYGMNIYRISKEQYEVLGSRPEASDKFTTHIEKEWPVGNWNWHDIRGCEPQWYVLHDGYGERNLLCASPHTLARLRSSLGENPKLNKVAPEKDNIKHVIAVKRVTITDMPVDIILMICRHLPPRDFTSFCFTSPRYLRHPKLKFYETLTKKSFPLYELHPKTENDFQWRGRFDALRLNALQRIRPLITHQDVTETRIIISDEFATLMCLSHYGIKNHATTGIPSRVIIAFLRIYGLLTQDLTMNSLPLCLQSATLGEEGIILLAPVQHLSRYTLARAAEPLIIMYEMFGPCTKFKQSTCDINGNPTEIVDVEDCSLYFAQLKMLCDFSGVDIKTTPVNDFGAAEISPEIMQECKTRWLLSGFTLN